MASKEYFELKEQFDLLSTLAKCINTVEEIREAYPQLDEIPLEDVEGFLCKEYTYFKDKIEQQLKLK